MDDKQKMIVVGVLGAALLGVAVFQLIPKGAPAPEPAKTDLAVDTSAPQPQLASTNQDPEKPKNPAVAFALARRDPFAVPSNIVASLVRNDGLSSSTPPPTTPLNQNLSRLPRPGASSVSGPINVTSSADGGGNAGGGAALPTVEPEHPPFGYHVAGVVLGRVPAVVFKDSQGNQRLIAQGGSIDGDAVLQSVGLTKVVVLYFGKTISLPVGEETNAQ